MAKSGPIIIIEDDADDEEIFRAVLGELNVTNELVCFRTTKEAFQFLSATTEAPFIILSDINLPGQTGLNFKRQLDSDPVLRRKSIPFIFYSTSANQEEVTEAYTQMTIQGFFQKAGKIEDIKKHLKLIFDYWKECRHPNSV